VLTRPICSGLRSALEDDTFLASSPASSCTSGTLDVMPVSGEKERSDGRKEAVRWNNRVK
jgi:hypothetical protein